MTVAVEEFRDVALLPERFAVNAPIAHMLFQRGVEAPAAATVSQQIHVPKGFSIGLFATGLANARFLRPTPSGDLLVSVPRAGKIHLLERDADFDRIFCDVMMSDLTGMDVHAELAKHHVSVLWSDYFKAPHFEKYPHLHQLVNDTLKALSAAKGSNDPATGQKALDLIAEIDTIFWETKKA